MTSVIKFLFALLILFSFNLRASPKPTKILFQTESNEFTLGHIRIFYDKTGKNAVLLADSDKNGIPDQVEDIATQIWVTYQYFCKALKFPDPFKSPRYKNLTYIEVSLLNRDRLKGSNGLAFDELMDSRGRNDKPDEKAIRINLSRDIDPTRNLTPSHEMFHLIQNGATYFKNRWYTEGMARWSEMGLGDKVIDNGKLSFNSFLQNEEFNKKRLFKQSYSAAQSFWYLIATLDKENYLIVDKKIIKKLRQFRYKQGSLVMRTGKIKGASIMRSILIELNLQQDKAFRELKYDKWSEKNQRSANNSEYIFQAVKKVVGRIK